MHVGEANETCPELKVHGTVMESVTEDVYLGDIISNDGKNRKNINKRISKGLGVITQIMNLLEIVTFGPFYMEIALLLRETMFINGILNNAEAWYGLSKSEINDLEQLDRLLLRKILKAPVSTPQEALHLELGLIPIGVIIQAKRINFLHYIISRSESEMIHKLFTAQWLNPTRGDWTETVKGDLEDFNIPIKLEEIKKKSKESFKNEVKRKAKEYSMKLLLLKKAKHSKMDNLEYEDLHIQDYFKLDSVTTSEVQEAFRFRTRMVKLGENFRGQGGEAWCPLCKTHLDNQAHIFQCQVIGNKCDLECDSTNIYTNEVRIDVIRKIIIILKTRESLVEDMKKT